MQVNNIRSVPIKNQIQVQDLNPSGHNSVVPESVIDFLGKYNLAKYQKQFFKALQSNRFIEISKAIFDETGYMMVRLNHVSGDIKKKYGTLQNISNVKDHQDVYLFWHPPIIFNKFYYYYEGEEVLALQKMMAKMHLYTVGGGCVLRTDLRREHDDFSLDIRLLIAGMYAINTRRHEIKGPPGTPD